MQERLEYMKAKLYINALNDPIVCAVNKFHEFNRGVEKRWKAYCHLPLQKAKS